MFAVQAEVTRISLKRSVSFPSFQGNTSRVVKNYVPWKSEIGRVINGIRDVRILKKALFVADSPVVLAFLTATNVKTILAAAGLDARIVVSERIDVEKQPKIWPWPLLRWGLYRYADAVTANSHGALRSMESFVPRSKRFFVPNPIGFTTASHPFPRRKKMILNVGRLAHQKAQDILLKAYARVVASRPEWKLTIIGYGPDKQTLYDQASSLNLLDHIEWIDWTSEIERYYETAGIFALPSRYEGTPNALLEAMSFGVPSVVTDGSPGPLEHISDGVNGLIVPVDDEFRLANALLRLTESKELRDRFGTAARQTIEAIDQDAVYEAWATALALPVLEVKEHMDDTCGGVLKK